MIFHVKYMTFISIPPPPHSLTPRPAPPSWLPPPLTLVNSMTKLVKRRVKLALFDMSNFNR